MIVRPPETMYGEFEQIIHQGLADYARSLPPDRRVVLDHYHYADFARKVVGVGSVGTEAMMVLLMGDREDDPLFLQIKEASTSVLAPYAGASEYEHQGERVVHGQRLTQAASDAFLGWFTGTGERPARVLCPPAARQEGLGRGRGDVARGLAPTASSAAPRWPARTPAPATPRRSPATSATTTPSTARSNASPSPTPTRTTPTTPRSPGPPTSSASRSNAAYSQPAWSPTMSELTYLRVYRFDSSAEFEGGLVAAIERLELGRDGKLLDALFVRRDAASGALEAVDLSVGGADATFASLLDFRLDPDRRRALTERTFTERRGGVPRPLIESIAGTLEAGAAIFAVLQTGPTATVIEDAVAPRCGGQQIADEPFDARSLAQADRPLRAAVGAASAND